jgi:hypothetical protein
MPTTIKLDKDTRRKIEKIIKRPFKNLRQFWLDLYLQINRDTMKTFAMGGARGEHPRWKPLSMRTIRTPAGTSRIRYGTDGTPATLKGDELTTLKRRWGWGHIGEMRKGVRRYGTRTENIMQASGFFKKSFGLMKLGKNFMRYGTNYVMAEDIMSRGGGRNVLFITGQDERRYAEQFRTWYLKGFRD